MQKEGPRSVAGSMAGSMASAMSVHSMARILGESIRDQNGTEPEVRTVRLVMVLLAVSVAMMAAAASVVVELGSTELRQLSALTLAAGERSVLFEACAAWVESIVIVNAHDHLNMTLPEAEHMFGAVSEMQGFLQRDAERFQNLHEQLYSDLTAGAKEPHEWAASVPHPYFELRMSSVNASDMAVFGESVVDIFELRLDRGEIPLPNPEDLPPLPDGIPMGDFATAFREAQAVAAASNAIELLDMPLTEMAEQMAA